MLDLLGGGGRALEVLLEDLVISLHDLLDQMLMARMLGLFELRRHLHFFRMPRVVDEGVVGDEVGDAVETRALADRDLDRLRMHSERGAKTGQRLVEGGVGPVEAVHEDHAGDLALRRMAPQHPVLGLYTRDGVDHEDRQLAHGHRLDGVAHEVGVARRVDQRDLVAVPWKGDDGRRQTLLSFFLLGVGVRNRRAILDAPRTTDQPCSVQHRLDQAGLTVAVVTDQCHVSDGTYPRHHASSVACLQRVRVVRDSCSGTKDPPREARSISSRRR